VTRNRIRRRLRAAVTGVGGELVPGGCYLFGADQGADAEAFATIEASVADLLRQVGDCS
jgi:ribonuclease P protein component